MHDQMPHGDATATRPWRRFNRATAIVFVVALLGVAAFNLVVDPWGVFRVTSMRDGSETNERYRKMQYLLAHPNRYTAFLVGSSRMGLYDPTAAQAQWPDERWYNLAVFSGDANDAYLMLRTLKAHGTAIKRVVFGIDLFPFMMNERKDRFAHRQHPAVSGTSRLGFYGDYLFAQGGVAGFIKLLQAHQQTPDVRFDFEGTGQFTLPLWDQERKEDPRAYQARQFPNKHVTPVEYPLNEHAFSALQDFVDWLSHNAVKAQIFIHPHHRLDALGSVAASSIAVALQRIHTIVGDVPNFMERADWCTDDALYYDTKHYVPDLGARILAELRVEEETRTRPTRLLGGSAR